MSRAPRSTRCVQEPNHARVNFSGVSDERIVTGMTRMADLLRKVLAKGPTGQAPTSPP